MKDHGDPDAVSRAVSSLIESGLSELGTAVLPEQITQLTRLVTIVSEWSSRISLTGHRDPIEMAGQLILDAAALSRCLPELDDASRLTDLGSGVGFPGFPIAILRPGLEVALVESRQKRHHLQREIRRQLSLTRVIPILGRSDEVERLMSDVVVAQAMTQPREALQLMRQWVRPGGLVALPAGEFAEEPELPEEFDGIALREYRVPSTGRRRKLWVASVGGADPS